MGRVSVALVLALMLTACAPRGNMVFDPSAASVGTVETIFIGTTRGPNAETGDQFSRERRHDARYTRLDISIPPKRTAGEIHWPAPRRKPDATKDFLTTQEILYPDAPAFRSDLARTLAKSPRGQREATIFVHGFNSTYAEGAYRLAQLGHDLDLPGALVNYSWPSRGHALAYAYDRDSALFARDGLEELLHQVEAAGAERILLVGHSMGGALTMETLRQIAIDGDSRLLRKIEAVVLISPDIDLDVFRAQASRLTELRNPIFVFTSRKDRALSLSAKLSGEATRLGNVQNASELADVRVTLLDTTAFATGSGHFNVGNSPMLLALLGRIRDIDAVLAADQTTRTGLLPGAVLTVQSATQIVLSPVTAISGLQN